MSSFFYLIVVEVPPNLERIITPDKLEFGNLGETDENEKTVVIKLFENQGNIEKLVDPDADTLKYLSEVTKYGITKCYYYFIPWPSFRQVSLDDMYIEDCLELSIPISDSMKVMLFTS